MRLNRILVVSVLVAAAGSSAGTAVASSKGMVISTKKVRAAFGAEGIILHLTLAASPVTPASFLGYPSSDHRYGVLVSVFRTRAGAVAEFHRRWNHWHEQGLTSRQVNNIVTLVEPVHRHSHPIAVPRPVSAALTRLARS